MYPATTVTPRTVFTTDFLNTFHLLTLQGKLSLYDYYQSIVRLTDNMGGRQVVSNFILSARHHSYTCR